MKVHLLNSISSELTACGLSACHNKTSHWQKHIGNIVDVNCKNCLRTKLYKGDITNAIKKLITR